MTRLSQLLHLDDGEFVEARAAEEAKPLPQRVRLRPNWGRDMIAYLRAQDGIDFPPKPVEPPPIVLTDWSARIADDWKHVENNLDNLAKAVRRDSSRLTTSYAYSVRVLTEPFLAEVRNLTAVQLPEWRKALDVAAADELALYDAEGEVAL